MSGLDSKAEILLIAADILGELLQENIAGVVRLIANNKLDDAHKVAFPGSVWAMGRNCRVNHLVYCRRSWGVHVTDNVYSRLRWQSVCGKHSWNVRMLENEHLDADRCSSCKYLVRQVLKKTGVALHE